MRILISGITSFLGINTGKALLKKGHEVYGILRPESRNKERLKGEKGIQLLSLNMKAFFFGRKNRGEKRKVTLLEIVMLLPKVLVCLPWPSLTLMSFCILPGTVSVPWGVRIL